MSLCQGIKRTKSFMSCFEKLWISHRVCKTSSVDLEDWIETSRKISGLTRLWNWRWMKVTLDTLLRWVFMTLETNVLYICCILCTLWLHYMWKNNTIISSQNSYSQLFKTEKSASMGLPASRGILARWFCLAGSFSYPVAKKFASVLISLSTK